MNQPPESSPTPLPRRRFLQYAGGSLVLATAGVLLWETGRRNRATRGSNPFRLDLGRFFDIDPALVHFEPAGRFAVPRPDPRRMTVDLHGRLHVAAGRYVVMLDRHGTRLEELACAAPVRCVAVADDELRYAGFHDHIEAFDQRGQRIAVWDQLEGRPFLTGLAVGAKELFAADSGNRLIWRYDRSGRLLGRIGERDPNRDIPGLVVPSPCLDVVLGADNLVCANNPGRHRIEYYTVEGHLEHSWGRASAEIDGFSGCCNPVAIASVADGRLLTCEKGMPRVKIYRDSGQFESVVAGPDRFLDATREESITNVDPAQIARLDGGVDGAGRVYVLDALAQDLQVFERSGSLAMPDVPNRI